LKRRALLGGAAVITLPILLGGCSKKRAAELKPHPDVAVLTAATAAEEDLVALYEAVRTAHADLAGRLDPVLAHHRAHLSVLRGHYRPGTVVTSPAPPPAPRPRPTAPAEPAQALAALRAAERRAATDRVRDVERIDAAGLAQLFASIGAAEAGHLTALTPARP
jgi:hypothetical protein